MVLCQSNNYFYRKNNTVQVFKLKVDQLIFHETLLLDRFINYKKKIIKIEKFYLAIYKNIVIIISLNVSVILMCS
jgi:hypothetical protein